MISPLYQVLLIFGLIGASSSYTLQITVQVSETGIDDPSCMKNETCKTLTYFLGLLSRTSFHQSTAITVNITYNQTIKNYSNYTFSQQHILSVKIVGHNQVYIILNSSMKMNHYNSKLYWAWIGLGFISGTDHTNLSIYHGGFNSLAILNCRIMTADWVFRCIQKLVINKNEFGQVEICPTLRIAPSFDKFTLSFRTISFLTAALTNQ